MPKRTIISETEFFLNLLGGERDFRNTEMHGFDFAAHDLYRPVLTYLNAVQEGFKQEPVDISGASLKRVKAGGIVLPYLLAKKSKEGYKTELEEVDFKDAILDYAKFLDAELQNVIFRDAKLKKVEFNGSFLYEVVYEGADLEDADFEGAPLMACSQEGVDFSLAKNVQFLEPQSPGEIQGDSLDAVLEQVREIDVLAVEVVDQGLAAMRAVNPVVLSPQAESPEESLDIVIDVEPAGEVVECPPLDADDERAAEIIADMAPTVNLPPLEEVLTPYRLEQKKKAEGKKGSKKKWAGVLSGAACAALLVGYSGAHLVVTTHVLDNSALVGGGDNVVKKKGPLVKKAAIKKKKKPTAKPFVKLSDEKKRSTLLDIVKKIEGEIVFPVPDASEFNKKQGLGLNENSTNFGSLRKKGPHNGPDIYGFGKNVVAIADGEVVVLGRNIPKESKTDHGNLLVLRHEVEGDYDLFSHYLHIGALDGGLKKGDKVKKGQVLARVDCTGMSNKRGHLYPLGSKICKRKAHLHLQMRVGYDDGPDESGAHMNPIFFYPAEATEKARNEMQKAEKNWLSVPANSLRENVKYKKLEPYGSFKSLVSGEVYTAPVKSEPVPEAKKPKTPESLEEMTEDERLYNSGKPLFRSKKPEDKCAALDIYERVAAMDGSEWQGKAKITVKTLKGKLKKMKYECED